MVVNLQGGTANQLFQWCFGRSQSLARGEELLFDISKCGGIRPYALDAFDIEVPIAKPEDIMGREVRNEPVFRYDSTVGMEPPGLYWNGYWQTEKYFNVPVIRKELKFKSMPSRTAQDWAALFGNTCFIHVRRGDYTREPHLSFHGNMSLDYYSRAVAHIRAIDPDCTFFVFSDDPDLLSFVGFKVIKDTTPVEDLWLMSHCRHGIMANSSFSWFGSWLGPDINGGTVIAPQRWFKDPSMHYEDVVPERWHKLEN